MPIEDPNLDLVLRLNTGVRGYLDYQDAMNKHVRKEFAAILEPAGNELQLFFANALEAGKFATASELKVREQQRLVAIDRASPDSEFTGAAVQYNQQATRAARRAIKLLGDAEGQLRQGRLAELADAHRDPDVKRAVADGKESLTQNLIKLNIQPADFREVLDIFDETAAAAESDGVAGVLGRARENLDRFVELRNEADRGTGPHSPLPWWKYVVIAVVLGAAVFGIVACFVWTACTWVWPAIAALAPWIFGMIDRGC